MIKIGGVIDILGTNPVAMITGVGMLITTGGTLIATSGKTMNLRRAFALGRTWAAWRNRTASLISPPTGGVGPKPVSRIGAVRRGAQAARRSP